MKRNHQPWANVATFEDFNAAKILESIFKGKGIEARTYNDRLLQLFLFLCPPRVTYRVQVRQNEFEHVTNLMDTDQNIFTAVEKALHCPSCGSLRINYPQMTRKFILPTLLLHLGIIFRVIDHEAYCEFCHFTWNLPKGHSTTPEKAHATG